MPSQRFVPHPPAADSAEPALLRIDVSCPDAETVFVSPAGEADVCTVAGLGQALWDAMNEDRPRVVVDLDRLTFMDASTLGLLVGARRRASAAGKVLKVRCSTRHGRRLLTTTGLDGLLDQRA